MMIRIGRRRLVGVGPRIHFWLRAQSSTSSSNESILENWPGEYRSGINMLIRLISHDSGYAAKAKERYIDGRHWTRYVSSFRRRLVKEPLSLFKTEQLVDFCNMVEKIDENEINEDENRTLEEVVAPKSDSSQIPAGKQKTLESSSHIQSCKDILFTVMLSNAEKDLSSAINAFHTLCSTSDLRIPHEWYPYARIMKRKIIYHGGPTNSGKTYHALQRLRGARPEMGGGLYCGPLRLLALEVYEQLNRHGVYTDLLTGQEKREVPFSTHVSSTLEMVNMSKEYDVAVIDEIQMIADEHRGYAWTRALQGLRANEIHVCGGLEASTLVERLVAATGDDFELREYKRLSTLQVNEASLRGDYSKIRPGDCIVAFSRADIFSIRRQVEELTPYKCAVIYGQLPPETRSTQARLFNEDNTGYDVLVASDAIGMGLNLNIRRIVFHTTVKRGGNSGVGAEGGAYQVDPSSIKQIAGRAGRMSSDYKIGEVTAWQETDLAYIRAVMSWEIPQIKSAGIFPSVEQVELFAQQLRQTFLAGGAAGDEGGAGVGVGAGAGGVGGSLGLVGGGAALDESSSTVTSATASVATTTTKNSPSSVVGADGSASSSQTNARSIREAYESPSLVSEASLRDQTRLSALLERFVELAQMDGRYFLCEHDDMAVVANWLHSIPLTLVDSFVFANAPVNTRDTLAMNMLYQFAAAYAAMKPVALNVRLSRTKPRDVKELAELCSKHNVLDLYLWLSFRFPKFFVERDLCLEQKAYAVALIEKSLDSNLLQQKFSLAQEYKTIRTKFKGVCPDGLPPLSFGEEIRSKTQEMIKKIDIQYLECFPFEDDQDGDMYVQKRTLREASPSRQSPVLKL